MNRRHRKASAKYLFFLGWPQAHAYDAKERWYFEEHQERLMARGARAVRNLRFLLSRPAVLLPGKAA